MTQFRLLTDCVHDGLHVRSGEIVERPEDWKGPVKAVPVFKDGKRIFEDVPLFEKIEDEEKA